MHPEEQMRGGDVENGAADETKSGTEGATSRMEESFDKSSQGGSSQGGSFDRETHERESAGGSEKGSCEGGSVPASSFSKGEESTVSEGGTRRTFFKRSSTKTALERQESGTAEVKKAVFHVHIHGGMVGGLAAALNSKKLLAKPLKQAIVVPSLNEYYRQNPSEPAVDLGLLHVAVNDREVNLDLQESAASFVVLQPGKEPEPVKVVLTLPLISSEARDSLEAAAAAAAASRGEGGPAPEIVGPQQERDSTPQRPALLRRRSSSGLAPASTSSRDEETSAEDEALRRKRSLTRRRSFDVNMEELPSFALISKEMVGVRDNTKSLARLVTATKMDPISAGLVRRVFRALDKEKKGYLNEIDIEMWIHHFGALPGNVLHQCGVTDHKKWQVDEFREICRHVIEQKGHADFGVMANGLEASIKGRVDEIEIYYHMLALKIDQWSKYLFFSGYTICIFVLFMAREWGGFGE